MTTLSKPRAGSGCAKAHARDKVDHPAKVFSDPRQIVTDPTLSLLEKYRALNSLEQDARQLAVASAEVMSGGEQTMLRDVILAKRSLEPPADVAFSVVMRTLEDRSRDTRGTQTHALITRAIDALTAVRDALGEQAPLARPEVPEPGSQEEIQEEIEKEKLDPGA